MSHHTNLKPWQVLNSKMIHATPWINVIEDECLTDNKKLTYTYVRRVDEGPLIIPEDQDGSLWLVCQYRHPIKKIIWQFPVEGTLPSESWEAAAARGIKEELRMSTTNIVPLGEFYIDPGGSQQKYQIFLARGLRPIQEEVFHDEEVEDLETQKFTREKIDELIQSGEICDNWTLAALYLYEKYEKLNHTGLKAK